MAVSGRIDGDALVAGDRSRGGHVQVTKKLQVHSFLPFKFHGRKQATSSQSELLVCFSLPRFCLVLSSISLRGLKYVAKQRSPRIQAIASELARSSHDIIALQEIWVFADYEHVRESVSKRLPYAKFFYRSAKLSFFAFLCSI